MLVSRPHTLLSLFVFFFNDTATTEIYTLSLHDALPIWQHCCGSSRAGRATRDRIRARKVPAFSYWRIVAAVQHESVYANGSARKIFARRLHQKIRRRNHRRVLGEWDKVLL